MRLAANGNNDVASGVPGTAFLGKKAINPADASIIQVRHKQHSHRLAMSMEPHREHRLIPGPLIYRLDAAQCN
jgi:hypothetical protein